MDSTERISIHLVTREGRQDIEDLVTREMPFTIILNNRELVTLLCSPLELEYLAVGFLASEGLIKSRDEVKALIVDEQRGVARVETKEEKDFPSELLFKRLITSGCSGGVSFYRPSDAQNRVRVTSQISVSATWIFSLVKQFQNSSQIFQATGGVHSAALCDMSEILVFSEDIGRHNAIDKVFGRCMLDDIPTDDRIVITSGRISSEILLKVAKRNVPVLVSRSAPTNIGVRLAEDLGVTLLGFVRGEKMNIYAHRWRIASDGK